jgi:hypothetical protein
MLVHDVVLAEVWNQDDSAVDTLDISKHEWRKRALADGERVSIVEVRAPVGAAGVRVVQCWVPLASWRVRAGLQRLCNS